MMKKKILLIVGILSLVLTACGGDKPAEDKDTAEVNSNVEEPVSDDLEYKYFEEDDGSLLIYAVSSEMEVLPEVIEFPSEIDGKTVSILEKVFEGDCRGQKEIIVPDSVKEIRSNTFSLADTIEKITINGTEILREESIMMCANLKTLIIAEGTKVIESEVGYACENLKEVYLPASVEEIADYTCFGGCSENLTIYVPAGSYAEEWATQMGYNVKAQ